MKNLTYALLVIFILGSPSFGAPDQEDIVIATGTTHNGNVITSNVDITVMDGARVNGEVRTTSGDIYIETNARVRKIKSTSGDIFIDEGVTVDQTIKNTDGSIRIKQNSTIKGNITTETGDIRVDGSMLKKSIKTRHGDIILKQGTYVKNDIRILNRGQGAGLEILDIYLGQEVYVKGNASAHHSNDQVQIQLFGGEVRGNIRRITIIDNPGNEEECGGIAAWNSSTAYTEGDIVSYDDHRWLAAWYTQNQQPGTTGNNGSWQDLGECDYDVDACGGRQLWHQTIIFQKNDETVYDDNIYRAKWYSRGDNPEDSGQWGVWQDRGPCEDDDDD
ncbi:MAG: DUF4097 family beta strand repeat-containing protein [Candidatus Marinimicrobia bacterium]|nr:DUF4097 family beta strand repeat-containing protein [Candidatus Neomarinimicrobiota bacterium]